MTIADALRHLLRSGVRHIGELEFQASVGDRPYLLSHFMDFPLVEQAAFGGLEFHEGPDDARELSTYTADGHYRFAKAQMNLKRGWVMALADEEQLRQALDQFYPAGLGLYLALQRGGLVVENLRDKLQRQSGMFRFARNISDSAAQCLVGELCGPAHQCAKRILWQLDATTPLLPTEASHFNGIPPGVPEAAAIPLLCREPCNHFVAECRRLAKEEAGPT